MDSCNQKRLGILPMGKVDRVNKGEAFLSKGRGTVKGNYRGSYSENSEKVKMQGVLRKTGREMIISSRHKS